MGTGPIFTNDGVYPTGDVTPEILKEIEKERKLIQESQLELKF